MVTSRDRILDAAAEIMRTEGIHQATTRQIAGRAGFSEALLYKHFSDKAEILKAVMRERMPNLVETLDALKHRAGQGTVAANLRTLVTAALPFYEEAFPMLAGHISQRGLLDPGDEGLWQPDSGPMRPLIELSDYIRAERSLGRVDPDVVPESAAALLLGACLQYAVWRHLSGHVESEPDVTAERLVRTLGTGLGLDD